MSRLGYQPTTREYSGAAGAHQGAARAVGALLYLSVELSVWALNGFGCQCNADMFCLFS